MNSVAYLDNYVVLNEDNPFGYTYDICTCIGMLVHKRNSAILAHIYAGIKENDIDLEQVNKILDESDDEITYVELFTGYFTNPKNINIIKEILNNKRMFYDIKSSNIDIYKKGSIGYNYINDKYYHVNEDFEIEDGFSLKKII